MKIIKVCSCGKRHYGIPNSAREWIDAGEFLGWFFECTCHSTMFITCKNFESWAGCAG